jgi:hypothetical protein
LKIPSAGKMRVALLVEHYKFKVNFEYILRVEICSEKRLHEESFDWGKFSSPIMIKPLPACLLLNIDL